MRVRDWALSPSAQGDNAYRQNGPSRYLQYRDELIFLQTNASGFVEPTMKTPHKEVEILPLFLIRERQEVAIKPFGLLAPPELNCLTGNAVSQSKGDEISHPFLAPMGQIPGQNGCCLQGIKVSNFRNRFLQPPNFTPNLGGLPALSPCRSPPFPKQPPFQKKALFPSTITPAAPPLASGPPPVSGH